MTRETRAAKSAADFDTDSGRLLLMGLRGVGKSSVGALVARRAAVAFADSDAEIEFVTGRRIADIAQQDGWPRFREIESDAIRRILASPVRVISAGGGAPTIPANRDALRAVETRVWLHADPAELRQRLRKEPGGADRRPVLIGNSPLDEIEALLAEREPVYREFATHTLATDGLTVEEVALRVLSLWRERSTEARHASA